jgi:hypothetical protein
MADRNAAGLRDRLITIEACTDDLGTTRYPIEDWTPLVTLYANRTTGGGDESFGAHQLSGRGDDTWTIPYRADCDPELLDVVKLRRLVAYGRVHDIVGAAVVGPRRALELSTRAKVG